MLDKVLTGTLTLHSLRPVDLSSCTKAEILAFFENSYDLNESLFTALKDDSVFYKCPDRLRLPLIFYYAHTACVYVNKLILAGLLKPEERVNLDYETMFETGVDEMSWDDTENFRMGGRFKWPRLDNVVEYRRKVRHLVVDIINATPLQLPIDMESPWWGLLMGIDHERIHIETSAVLIHQLPTDLVTCPPGWTYAPSTQGEGAGENSMIAKEATKVTLGKPFDFPSYSWDNDYGSITCTVPAFEASKFPVTNGEYARFVEAGGYGEMRYWSGEGWQWVQYRQAKHPTFWVCDKGCKSGCGAALASHSHCKSPNHVTNGQNGYCNGHEEADDNGHQGNDEGGGQEYRLRVMFDNITMPWDWPVEVNYHEARAFCAWKGDGFRLPCEAEYSVLRGEQMPLSEGTAGDIVFHDKPNANLNLQFGSSCPVNYYPPNEAGFYDVAGNLFEWTEDHFNGFPGYKTIHLYDDYSGPCMDGRHNLMLGGSWISTGNQASKFNRLGFRRHFFQHCGFRMVRSIPPTEGGKAEVPVRLINSEIFVLGDGYLVNEDAFEDTSVVPLRSPSLNVQYALERKDHLNQMLHDEYSTLQSFPMELVEVVKDWVKEQDIPRSRALHMGCGTGRATVSLSHLFDDTIGQDFVARFIDVCQQLQKGQQVTFTLEGVAKMTECQAAFPPETTPAYITFKLMTWLPNELGCYDFIYCTLLDRVTNIKSWIVRLPELLRKHGMVVIASVICDQSTLAPLMANRFELIKAVVLDGPGDKKTHLTAWQHTL